MPHAVILTHLAAFVAGSLFVILLRVAASFVAGWREDVPYDEPEYEPY